jgi:hypothetical protein
MDDQNQEGAVVLSIQARSAARHHHAGPAGGEQGPDQLRKAQLKSRETEMYETSLLCGQRHYPDTRWPELARIDDFPVL